MTGGAITANTGTSCGLEIGGYANTAEMSGGEISMHANGSGVIVNRYFTMSGGTISGNRCSIFCDTQNSSFVMTGGTISGNTGDPGSGVYLGYGKITIDGIVTISDPIACEGWNGNNNTIYLGSNFDPSDENFKPNEKIRINVMAMNSGGFNASWGSTAGKVLIKGGTAEAPSAVSQERFGKFVGGNAFESVAPGAASKGGIVSLTLNGSSQGVAKWTAQ
jgi:hypothetical protein